MNLTSIGDRKTPSRPIEITTDPELGLPSDLKTLLLIGHAASSMAASAAYAPRVVSNVADDVAAVNELKSAYGENSEIVKMVQAAIKANTLSGQGTFPNITIVPLKSTDTGFGPADEALDNNRNQRANIIVTPYDLNSNSGSLRTKLLDHVTLISGPNRPDNQQFGAFGLGANFSAAPSALTAFDSQYLVGIALRDSAPVVSLGEVAAAAAGRIGSNGVPFQPLDKSQIGGLVAPVNQSDWYSVGAGLDSETVLNQGWTPLSVQPNGNVCFVRTVTGRITNGQGADVTAYYDLQDWECLYFWRKTIWTRQSQPDFTNVKASQSVARNLRGEMVRLAILFEDQGMFQATSQLSRQFVVQRSASDRHRFDVLTPVNVIPGLHVIATRIAAGTQFDAFSI